MEVIVLKYVQIVCITIFMQGNANCAQLMSHSEEMSNLKVAACAAECLQLKTQNYKLTECYQHCANRTDSLHEVTSLHQTLSDTTFRLFCRDSTRLFIQVDVGNITDEKLIYLLIIQETKVAFVDRFVYISDEPLIELRDLKPQESYNISATIVTSNYDVYFLGTQIFTTLKIEYKPENVTDIWLEEVNPIEGDGEHVNVVIGWNPARDQTCMNELVLHGENIELAPLDKEDRDLYYHEFYNLNYNSEYSVAVRGINSKFPRLESDLVWKLLTTKNCTDFEENVGVCGPETIKNMNAHFANIEGHIFSVNITWNEMETPPEFYTLEIRDLKPNVFEDGTVEIHNFTIGGNKTSIFIPKIAIKGPSCFIKLTAYLHKYNTTGQLLPYVYDLKTTSRLADIFFYIFVGLFTVVLIVLFYFWRGQIVGTLTQKQLLDHMDLDLIKTISNRLTLEAIDDLRRDEKMEVERENITLLETLGEGAFGVVKKAILVKNGQKLQVAVKMLKNSDNIEDIKQFHKEISVMKSVEAHPNIVGIIGHCTSDIEEFMLLTEFCDSGNLLDLLRNEFKKQFAFYDKKFSSPPAARTQNHQDNYLHNFDEGDKEISTKIVGCSSRLFVVNQMYDDMNNNSNEIETHQAPLQAIGMTATNALYLELSDNDPKPVIVEIEEPENPQEFLTSNHLVSFAKQVCDGMNFLARKKVVHRDLAARNILVCSDKTVKIADFGLSRDIYQDNIYRKIGQGKVPIKWLALESMTEQVYTSQSDVWSFGILLHEIVTLGKSPYPALPNSAKQLIKYLSNGQRMGKSSHCHQELYDVMMSCWRETPANRPSFEKLSSTLNHFLKREASFEQFIDLQKLFDKCTNEMSYMKPIA